MMCLFGKHYFLEDSMYPFLHHIRWFLVGFLCFAADAYMLCRIYSGLDDTISQTRVIMA